MIESSGTVPSFAISPNGVAFDTDNLHGFTLPCRTKELVVSQPARA